MYMFGGEGESQLYQDLFVFDANNKAWSEITGIDLPSARKHACMACNFPEFAIFGGTTVKGYDGDLYSMNIANSSIKRLSTSDSYSSPGTRAFSECWAYTLPDGEKEFLVAIGETDGEVPYSTVYTYNLDNQAWRLTGETSARRQSAAIKANDRLLFIGGERFGFDPLSDVISHNLKTNTTTVLGSLSRSFFKGAISYVKTSLYVHGGSDTSTKKIRRNVPSVSFVRLDMIENCGSQERDWPCSEGTYQSSSGICEFCPRGTYNPFVGASECLKCPRGSASSRLGNSSLRQCYPCSEGYFASVEGSSRCLMCPYGFTCSIGNYEPALKTEKADKVKSSQPSSYSANIKDINDNGLTFQISMIVLCSVVILLYIFGLRPIWLSKLDLYSKLHSHFVDEPMVVRVTPLGGLFSVLFVLVALIFIYSTLIVFILDNIAETKALVPMVTLEEDFEKVMRRQISADLTVNLRLDNYRSVCGPPEGGACSSEVYVTTAEVDADWIEVTCMHDEVTCTITWVCKNCVINTGASIEYNMQQLISLSDHIVANVTSSSSIPSESSSVEQAVSSAFDTVYRGPEFSQLYFEMTPSVRPRQVFMTDSPQWNTDQTGYHVADTKVAVEGSTTSAYK
jgi:hypothetical protein